MQIEVATIVEDATISEAALQMRLEGVRSLIIEPRHPDDPFGIITHSDMVTKVLADGKDPKTIPVSEVMIKPAVQVAPGMDVQHIVAFSANMAMPGCRLRQAVRHHLDDDLVTGEPIRLHKAELAFALLRLLRS
jgi:signal-transduction protein with cAMP-binding, CBS, and nucleotidyltransferase domain